MSQLSVKCLSDLPILNIYDRKRKKTQILHDTTT